MQNLEFEEVQGKYVKFHLFSYQKSASKDSKFRQFTQNTIKQADQYTILWYDDRMKNYTNLLEFLNNKRLVSAKIKTYLIVNKEEIAEGVDEIRNNASKDNLIKSQIQILLKRSLTD